MFLASNICSSLQSRRWRRRLVVGSIEDRRCRCPPVRSSRCFKLNWPRGQTWSGVRVRFLSVRFRRPFSVGYSRDSSTDGHIENGTYLRGDWTDGVADLAKNIRDYFNLSFYFRVKIYLRRRPAIYKKLFQIDFGQIWQ